MKYERALEIIKSHKTTKVSRPKPSQKSDQLVVCANTKSVNMTANTVNAQGLHSNLQAPVKRATEDVMFSLAVQQAKIDVMKASNTITRPQGMKADRCIDKTSRLKRINPGTTGSRMQFTSALDNMQDMQFVKTYKSAVIYWRTNGSFAPTPVDHISLSAYLAAKGTNKVNGG